jgi:hypothetical protein
MLVILGVEHWAWHDNEINMWTATGQVTIASRAWLVLILPLGLAVWSAKRFAKGLRHVMAGLGVFILIWRLWDGWMWRILGDHLVSWKTVLVVRAHAPSLFISVTKNHISQLVAMIVTTLLIVVVVPVTARMLEQHWQKFGQRIFAKRIAITLTIAALLWQFPSPITMHATLGCAECDLWNVWSRSSSPSPDVTVESSYLTPLNELQNAIQSRIDRLRRLSVASAPDPKSAFPDILVIAIESLRPELLSEDVMPHIVALGRTGLVSQMHFSGGNSTTLGLFSLLNGLEGIWYESPVRYRPLLNHLLHQVGYKVGFFAGQDDWDAFRMDGFIHPQHFDEFITRPPRGMQSDRLAVELTGDFLDQRYKDSIPRAAVLYLYATHAPYWSYDDDRLSQPAADDGFGIPYGPKDRPYVWNRYLNSARSIDRLISHLVRRRQTVVIVTGDHGEAFLEDTTVGHGTRLSSVQTRTFAVITAPNVIPQVCSSATMHADVLPTLLNAIGVQLTDPQALDGVDLTAMTAHRGSRVISIRDYLTDAIALVAGDGEVNAVPFAQQIHVPRALFRSVESSQSDRQTRIGISNIGPLDQHGLRQPGLPDASSVTRSWLHARFPQ